MPNIQIAIPEFFIQGKEHTELQEAIKEGLIIRDYITGKISLKEIKGILEMQYMDDVIKWLQARGINNIKPHLIEINQKKYSKWAKIVKRIRNDPDIKNPEFQKAWNKMKEDMKELRENFEFIHDK
ncbi:MAG: hypothetical protein KAH84_07085 [Thiomargarita sp.]|nr:hypothetical protein [Thiomargarita sp.]